MPSTPRKLNTTSPARRGSTQPRRATLRPVNFVRRTFEARTPAHPPISAPEELVEFLGTARVNQATSLPSFFPLDFNPRKTIPLVFENIRVDKEKHADVVARTSLVHTAKVFVPSDSIATEMCDALADFCQQAEISCYNFFWINRGEDAEDTSIDLTWFVRDGEEPPTMPKTGDNVYGTVSWYTKGNNTNMTFNVTRVETPKKKGGDSSK